jgi:hypothetical protein
MFLEKCFLKCFGVSSVSLSFGGRAFHNCQTVLKGAELRSDKTDSIQFSSSRGPSMSCAEARSRCTSLWKMRMR